MKLGEIELTLQEGGRGARPQYRSPNNGWLLYMDRENIQDEQGKIPKQITMSIWVNSGEERQP